MRGRRCTVVALLTALAGCAKSDMPADAGSPPDGAPEMDAGPGVDAGPGSDAAAPACLGPSEPLTPVWSRSFGGPEHDTHIALVAASSGAIYATGHVIETVDFGGGPYVPAGLFSDGFVAGFDPTGGYRWAIFFGSESNDGGVDIATDPAGNVVVAGDYGATADFGGGPLPPAVDLGAAFVASLTSDGAHRWSRGFPATRDARALSVAVDGGGDVYVAGTFRGRFDVDVATLERVADDDIFVLALSGSDGAVRWARQLPGEEFLGEAHIGIGAGGAVYVGGQRNGSTVSVTRLDAAGGEVRWQREIVAGGFFAHVGAIAVRPGGGVYVVGTFDGELRERDVVGEGEDAMVFAVAFDDAGERLWARTTSGTGRVLANAAVVDAAGDLVVTGGYTRVADFGAGPLPAAAEIPEIFVARYDACGALRSAQHLGSNAADGVSLAATPDGAVLLGAAFWLTTRIAGSHTSNGFTDMLMAELR